jgi:hypothetical protein
MSLHFLRGNPQAPKGHAILVARSSGDPRTVYCTYCIVPPIPMSLAKYLPPLLAAQLPVEELRDAASVSGMPIPPMLEEGFNLEYLQMLAERRDDDVCDLGTINASDEGSRLQLAAMSSNEYGQLYATYMASVRQSPVSPPETLQEPVPLDDLDAEEILLQTMPDSQKLAELGKLVGTARYAIEGHDHALLRETQEHMQRIVRNLAEKYRGKELIAAALKPGEQGAKLSELYLSRAYKLLNEEYADIPGIERAIRDLQQQ